VIEKPRLAKLVGKHPFMEALGVMKDGLVCAGFFTCF
jgi:hypothetical protein